MAFGATLPVERRPQAIFGGLHFLEVLQSVVELRQFCAGQSRQWIGQILPALRVSPPLSEQQDQNACCCKKNEPGLVYCPSHRFSLETPHVSESASHTALPETFPGTRRTRVSYMWPPA